jgi:hypothetical protein
MYLRSHFQQLLMQQPEREAELDLMQKRHNKLYR